MDVRSSRLPAADKLVNGVFVALPPLTDVVGVEVDVPLVPREAALAAFSAKRFCLDAEGAISNS